MTDQLDRYARGELNAAESRQLAQAALEDPELFEELTSTALVQAALENPSVVKVRRFPRVMAAAAIAACLAIAIGVVGIRRSQPAVPSGPPVLIADGSPARDTFRAPDSGSREPRQTGRVVSIESGEAWIDLGEIDGVEKDLRLSDRLVVTAVFGDRARAKISGSVQPGDPVAVPAASYSNALEKAGVADYRAGSLDAAEKHLQAALDAQRTTATLNNRGALAERRGDLKLARTMYDAAWSLAGSEKDRTVIQSNLARIQASR